MHHSQGDQGAAGHAAEEEIHLPSPTMAPPIIGVGVTLLSFGILFGIGLIVAGAILMVVGIVIWLVNDAREFEKAGEHGGHGGHH